MPGGSDSPNAANLIRTLLTLAITAFVAAAPLMASDPAVMKADDATITDMVKRSLIFNLSLDFKVTTNAGVVTLIGNACNIAERDLDTKLATEIMGVKSVVNKMVVLASAAKDD